MKKLDRFILRDVLSDGPAGTVYRADEILPGDNRRTVALKVLPPVAEGGITGESPEELRFFGEVRMLAQLGVHPHVVTLFAMGVTDGFPWLAMEYAAATLAQRMDDAPADPAEVWRLLEQVGRGLAAMHALKPPLVHQDLKPANILIDSSGNYKITDFSLATVSAAARTQGLATVRYAAPELLSSDLGQVGPATDLYALGHIAYEMALGNRLHRQQFPAVFEGNTSKEPPPNKWMMWHASLSIRPAPLAQAVRGFPVALSEVIERLMSKAISERYGAADELVSDLALLRQEPGESKASAAAPPSTQNVAKSPVPASIPLETPPMRVLAPPAPAATDPAGSRFWVRLRGKTTGPYDLAALQRLVKQGQISRLHQISADQVTWKQATEVEGLYRPTIV